MTPMQRQAILLELIQQLRDEDSWCGETHIQKSTFFLQEMLHVPLDFNFIFYSYGPYSFDLNDALTALRCDLLLNVRPRDPYGASLIPSENATKLRDKFPKTRKRYESAISVVANKLGKKNVAELERLATALFVQLQQPKGSPKELSAEIHRLKPHVSVEQAREALSWVSAMRDEIENASATG
jgi:hypothetical protein